jgi:hypothetical protein
MRVHEAKVTFVFLLLMILFAAVADRAIEEFTAVTPPPVNHKDQLVDKMYYIKDKFGACYSVIDHERGNEIFTSHATVDCEQVNMVETI